MTTTRWTCGIDGSGKATLLCQITENGEPANPFPVKLKGLCYSPAPMNGSNKFAPALGDWYWDDFNAGGTMIHGWSPLWQRDLPAMRRIGANTIRVYCMLSRQLNGDGTFPQPWNGGHLFTHGRFLDWCFNTTAPPLDRHSKYVLVGIPIPATMLWKQQYDKASDAEKTYWMNVLAETAASMAQHPGVVGFTVQNEQDGADVCYNNPEWADFWWGQIEKMAGIVKKAAPDKLVGMATHDDPNIPRKAAAWMAKCPSIDFWGVNSYQTQTLDSIFDDYDRLTGVARKPVLLTEWGMPATSHRDPGNPASIYEDPNTRAKAGDVLGRVVPQAYRHPLCIGLYYFEYCDEWWNEPGAPNIYTWWGGPSAPGLPNGYWDNEGFGLFSIRRGGSLPNNAPIWDARANGPALPIDVHYERSELTAVLTKIFHSVG
ncbi:MAG: hypothetical protein ACOY4R_10795 [Pseudomonadota bacterium]